MKADNMKYPDIADAKPIVIILISLWASYANGLSRSSGSDDSVENEYDDDDYYYSTPTVAPTVSAYEFAAGWVGSISYSAIAIVVLVSACLIAYSQSHKHYHDVVAQQGEQTSLLERRPTLPKATA
jgi:hypothetical protein